MRIIVPSQLYNASANVQTCTFKTENSLDCIYPSLIPPLVCTSIFGEHIRYEGVYPNGLLSMNREIANGDTGMSSTLRYILCDGLFYSTHSIEELLEKLERICPNPLDLPIDVLYFLSQPTINPLEQIYYNFNCSGVTEYLDL